MMKSNLWHFLGFLVILYLAYYIDGVQVKIQEQDEIIRSQNDLISTQNLYIKEVNKLLGINTGLLYIKPRDDSPVHRGPI